MDIIIFTMLDKFLYKFLKPANGCVQQVEFEQGSMGTITWCVCLKCSISGIKLLNAPNKPCNNISGSPCPSSMYLNFPSCLIS
jgi:hypothetical protein